MPDSSVRLDSVTRTYIKTWTSREVCAVDTEYSHWKAYNMIDSSIVFDIAAM